LPVLTPSGEFFWLCAKVGDAVSAATAAAVAIKIKVFRYFMFSSIALLLQKTACDLNSIGMTGLQDQREANAYVPAERANSIKAFHLEQ
jgi:hypothetical protein